MDGKVDPNLAAKLFLSNNDREALDRIEDPTWCVDQLVVALERNSNRHGDDYSGDHGLCDHHAALLRFADEYRLHVDAFGTFANRRDAVLDAFGASPAIQKTLTAAARRWENEAVQKWSQVKRCLGGMITELVDDVHRVSKVPISEVWDEVKS